MGSFAASIFNLLLGWIRGLVSGLWNLVNSAEARQGLEWLGDNWLWLTIAIAVIGLVIDYVIWFIRWRPYYVWRTWWRRLTRRSEPQAETPEMQAPYPQQEYYEEIYEEPWQEAAYYPPEAYEEVYEEPVHPGLTDTGLQESLGWIQPEETLPEEISQPAPRQRRSQREPLQPSLRRMRTGISQMAHRIDFLGLDRSDDEEENYAYMPPPPAVNKDQAFHAPVYPTHWQEDTK